MQNTIPIVSVLCTCYNHEKFVETALNSVLNQTYKNIELFIIDDCSTDSSIEVIRQWVTKNAFGTIIKNKENLGLTRSFNKAFEKTKGTYLVDLSADDELLPHFIESLLDTFETYKNDPVGIVYGNALVHFDNNSEESYVYFDRFSQEKKASTPDDGFIYKELIDHSNTICSVSSMIKRSVFEKLKGYDKQLTYEDYDFWIRVARDYHILYLDKTVVKRLKVSNSLGNSMHLGINKRNYCFKYSTYCVVKKTLYLNRTKKENEASIRKIRFEMKANAKILNFSLYLKYTWLLLKFLIKK